MVKEELNTGDCSNEQDITEEDKTGVCQRVITKHTGASYACCSAVSVRLEMEWHLASH